LKLIEVRQMFVKRKDQSKPSAFCRWRDRRAKVISESSCAEHEPDNVQLRKMAPCFASRLIDPAISTDKKAASFEAVFLFSTHP
jgi:hypothetical protein